MCSPDLRRPSAAPIRIRPVRLAYIGGLPCQAWGGFFALCGRLDGSLARWPILSLIHAIRHIASRAELWFMWPGFSGCNTPEQQGARCGRWSQIDVIRVHLLRRPCCGRWCREAHAAAIQGAETTMPALFRTIVLAALAAALLTPDG